MRILLAAPNRDLLQCYQKILTEDFGETIIAFDGTQLLSLLAEGSYDLAVLDLSLPRVRVDTLLRQLEREDVPAIALTGSPVNVKLLTQEPLARAFLPYPFQAEELCALIREVLEKKASTKRLSFANTELEEAAFQLHCGAPVTVEEINTLWSLLSGEALTPGNSGVCVAALNHKFAKYAVKAKIQYETGKGFTMVTEDE